MLPKHTVIAALSILGVAAVPSSAYAQQGPEQVLVQRAKLLDTQGRHDLAADNWRQVLLMNPGQADALAALIRFSRATGDTAKARQYEAALERQHPGTAITGAAAMTRSNDGGELLREASRLASAHKYTEALAMYQRAFGSEQPPDNWGISYYETEAAVPARLPHAVAGLRTLAAKYPANPSYRLALARVLTYRPGTRLEGARMLASFQGTPEQNEQARAAWKQAILWDPTAPAATETAKQYVQRFPDAELSSHLSAAPKHAAPAKPGSPLEGEGYRALASGDLSSAQEHFAALAAGSDHQGQGEAGLGYVAMKRKDFSAAVNHFEQARSSGVRSAALDKALTEARYWAAMAEGNEALSAGDADRAAASFERARQLKANRPEATEALGGSLLAEKDTEEAQNVLARALDANPHRAETWIAWMNAALEGGNAADVLARQTQMPQDVKQVLAHRPDFLALLAAAELGSGNQDVAARLIARIEELAASSGQAAAPQVRAAGRLLSLGYLEQAIELCSAAIKSEPENAGAWQTLVQAEHAAGRDRVATSVATRMPKSVDAAAMANPDFLLALAAVYQGEHQYTVAGQLLDRASSVSNLKPRTSSAIELQRASLALASGDPHTAYNLYRRMQGRDPGNAAAWTGAIAALHAGKHDAEALAAIEALSPDVTAQVRQDPAFLQTAAFVYSENGRSRDAMLCLHAVIRQYTSQHQPVPFAVDSETAWLQLNAGHDKELATTLERLGSNPHLTDDQANTLKQIWTTWSMRRAEAEFARGDRKAAVAILHAAVQAYPDQLNVRMALANMHARTGNPGLSVKMFLDLDWNHAAVEQYEAAINAALTAHNMKYADFWLKLGLEQYPGNPALLRAGARVEEERGDTRKAMRYLASARGNTDLKDLSPNLLEAELGKAGKGTSTRADAQNDGQTVATPQTELARMLGAAGGAQPRTELSDSWTSSPSDEPAAETLTSMHPVAYTVPSTSHGAAQSPREEDPLAGILASSKKTQPSSDGWPADDAPASDAANDADLPQATVHVKHAPETRRQPVRTPDPLAGLGLDGDFGQSDVADTGMQRMRPVSATANNGDGLRAILGGSSQPTAPRGSFAESLDPESKGVSSSSLTATPHTASRLLGAEPVMRSPQEKASDDLSTLQSRFSPWFATGGAYRGRSGTTGFDQLHQFEAEMEGSTVMGTGARLTVVTRPVSLQSGTPDASSNFRFGSGTSLPTTAQFASGLGGEVQFATRSLEMSAGYAPQNFAVRNFLGSFALRPAQGPITLRLYRDNVKDTLLSYAGMTDPATGQVWGGVVATGGALELHHGGADSGFYATVDGQKLTGRNVTDNTRVMGNAGAYWSALSNPFGTLKVGANLMAMHYALNERYFTLGQGGYFSPNSFFMVNAPVTWEGHPFRSTYYTLSGSLGMQNIQEGQAMSGSLVVGNGIQTLSGASYDLHGRVGHRMTDHWDLEAFVDANNSRQYSEHTAGFSVRYMKFAQPENATPGGFLNANTVRPLERP